MAGNHLAALRGEIDRIDAAMHDLLMERAAIIARLIEAKRSAPTSSAFRPDREMAVLRRLAERHEGGLPIDAVEGIWRVIIATFTHAQAPFAVHADAALGSEAMRDSARFHFGFTVPYLAHHDVSAALSAVAAADGDLGLIGLEPRPAAAWWVQLERPIAPKVIARLPFLPRPTHPAPAPVLVVARAAVETVNGGTALFSARLRQALDPAALAAEGLAVLAASGPSALVAADAAGVPRLPAYCEEPPVPVGSYPEPFALTG